MKHRRVIVLFDPIHHHAAHFVELAWRRGLRTVCLWSSRKNRGGAWQYNSLRSPAIAAHYPVDLSSVGLRHAAARLAEEHEVAAVIPHVETAVLPSVELALHLGLSWAQPGVMPLFRDKYTLKKFLAGARGGPRINGISLVRTVADVRHAMEAMDLNEVVLKPVDGYGNVSVGFFTRESSDFVIASHLEKTGAPMLLEERLFGAEYFVNGLVNASGVVDITGVGAYLRDTVNGKPNVEIGARTVKTTEAEFGPLAAYARLVLEASGVRRTPFHLDCILDAAGPCLVEVGARVVGGYILNPVLHGVDVMDGALVQYLDEGTDEPLSLDWNRYDSHVLGEVGGIAHRHGRIARIRGLDRAAGTPGFLHWGHRPLVGEKVAPTVSLMTNPWTAVVTAPDSDLWQERAHMVRSAVQLDVVAPGDHRPLLQSRALAPAAGRLIRRAGSYATIR